MATLATTSRLVGLILLVKAASVASLLAAEPELLPAAPQALVRPEAKMLGSLSCASAACHGGQEARSPRQEYGRWLADDPHAKAAQTLTSPEFRRILAVVSSGSEAGPVDPQVYARCAACHDPQGLAHAGGDHQSLLDSTPDLGTRGIGCESCHGPAERWLARHYERDVDRSALSALGMIDTKNLLVRGRACAACHVGDADHDLNHDMLAAGHPPLRFELSAYHDLIRKKHWSDRERIESREFKVQLWSAGQAAVLDCTLALVESRASRAEKRDKLTPWPEFAEYDCFACHQRLRASGFPLFSAGSKPAPGGLRVAWQPWNLALAANPPLAPLGQELQNLTIVDPAKVRDEVQRARSGMELPAEMTSGRLLTLVQSQATAPANTWAAACQELLALKAAYLTWRDENPGEKSAWASKYEQRLAAVGLALGFGSADFEWPAFDWEGLPAPKPSVEFASLGAISREIASLAEELAAVQNGGAMNTGTWHRRSLAIAALLCALLPAVLAAQEAPKFPLVSTAKCFECHFTPPQPGVPDAFRTSEDFCRREEAHTWQDRDKHRQSLYLLLKPEHLPLTERILGFKIAGVLAYELVDSAAAGKTQELVRSVAFHAGAKPEQVAVVRQCLACHAPVEERVEGGARLTTIEYGVSCQACHGPGRGYELPHQKAGWRLVKAEVKEQKFGLRDLRNPVRRAELRASCHVGSRGENPAKFVRHEWYANGHPPLPSLEPVTFAAQEPAHWRPLQEKLYRPGGFRYYATRPEAAELADILRFDLLGSVTEADLGAGYLDANRASFSPSPEKDMARSKDVLVSGLATLTAYAGILADWPAAEPLDFALFDCGACHHELRSKFPSQVRLRRGITVGRPPAAFWTVTLARLGAERASKSQPQLSVSIDAVLDEFDQAYTSRPFGDQVAMQVAAAKLRTACRSLGQTLASQPLDEPAAHELLLALLQPQRDEDRDYHAARQTAWAVREVLKDLAGVPVRNYALAGPGDPRPPVKNLPPNIVKLLGGVHGAAIAADHEQVRVRIDKLFDGGQPGDALWHAPLRLRLPAGQQETIVGHLPESLAAISQYDPDFFRQRLAAIREALSK